MKTAWLPEQEVSDHVTAGDMVTEEVVTVTQSTGSFQLMVTEESMTTPVAVSAGTVEETEGAVVSTVTEAGEP